MALNPTVTEQIARARADMRMGVPVLLVSETPALVIPAETLSAERLNDLHALGETVSLALTERRAATLKLAAYDGDLARILLSSEQTISWIQQTLWLDGMLLGSRNIVPENIQVRIVT